MKSTIVSVAWLSDHINDPNIIILDTSEKQNKSNLITEYPDLQINGARYFDTKNVFRDKENHIPNMLPNPSEFEKGCRKLGINNNSKIIVYDNLGVYNSPRVWWMFRVMGHEAVAVLDGGLPEWIKAGNETELIKNDEIEEGYFSSNFQPNKIKNASEVMANITAQNFTLIDARSIGRFYGSSPEPRADLKGGHVPESLNLPFSSVIENGKFLSKGDLARKLSELNIGGEPLVFTCGSGITACIILLAAELVNDNPKSLYDGSWSEWGQLEGAPISQ